MAVNNRETPIMGKYENREKRISNVFTISVFFGIQHTSEHQSGLRIEIRHISLLYRHLSRKIKYLDHLGNPTVSGRLKMYRIHIALHVTGIKWDGCVSIDKNISLLRNVLYSVHKDTGQFSSKKKVNLKLWSKRFSSS